MAAINDDLDPSGMDLYTSIPPSGATSAATIGLDILTHTTTPPALMSNAASSASNLLFPDSSNNDNNDFPFSSFNTAATATAADNDDALLPLLSDPTIPSFNSVLNNSFSDPTPVASTSQFVVPPLASTSAAGSTSSVPPGEAEAEASTSASASQASTSTLGPSKRGRGRPRKAPNAPTRSKYSRITKEEMSDEDDMHMRLMMNESLGPSSSSTASKGKSIASSTSTPSDTSNDRKGRRAGHASLSTSRVQAGETRTKSGRTVHKPEAFIPTSEPAFRRRKHYQPKNNTESIPCSVCGQSQSTPSNQIIFCDGCNTPYHQQCHDPPIPDSTSLSTSTWSTTVATTTTSPLPPLTTPLFSSLSNRSTSHSKSSGSASVNAQPPWYCAACEANRRTTLFPTSSWDENLPLSQIPENSANAYLQILPRENLVQLLWDVTQHYPEARLFPPNIQQLIDEDATRREQIRQARPDRAVPTAGSTDLTRSVLKRKRGDDLTASALSMSQFGLQGSNSVREEDNEEEEDEGEDERDGDFESTSTGVRTVKMARIGGTAAEQQQQREKEKRDVAVSTEEYIADYDMTHGIHTVYEEEGHIAMDHPGMSAAEGVERPDSMSYFEMLRNAIREINEPEGVPPRRLYEWISDRYKLPDNFRPSAGQALQKAARKGHFLKTGSLYRINPEHENMKAVKRPVRKHRPDDLGHSISTIASSGTISSTSNPSPGQHHRNLSNQTAKSGYSQGSNAASTGTGASTSAVNIAGPSDLALSVGGMSGSTRGAVARNTVSPGRGDHWTQGDSTRPGVSLEDVIARQQNTPISASALVGPSPRSPFSTLATATNVSASTMPQPPSMPNHYAQTQSSVYGDFNIGGMQQQQPPRQQQRHRQSLSYGSQSFPTPLRDMQPTQQQQNQMQLPQRQLPPLASPPLSGIHGSQTYNPAAEAGIDSMLADLMRHSPVDRRGQMQVQGHGQVPGQGQGPPQGQGQGQSSSMLLPPSMPMPASFSTQHLQQSQPSPGQPSPGTPMSPQHHHRRLSQSQHFVPARSQPSFQPQSQQQQHQRLASQHQQYMLNSSGDLDPSIFNPQFVPRQQQQAISFQQPQQQPQYALHSPQQQQQPQSRPQGQSAQQVQQSQQQQHQQHGQYSQQQPFSGQ